MAAVCSVICYFAISFISSLLLNHLRYNSYMKWWQRMNAMMRDKRLTAAELGRAANIHEKTIYKYADGSESV